MPVTLALVPRKSKNEEKRNVILRLRYGPLAQSHRCVEPELGLSIEGQAVINKLKESIEARLPGGALQKVYPLREDSPYEGRRSCTGRTSSCSNRHMNIEGIGIHYPSPKSSISGHSRRKASRILTFSKINEIGEFGQAASKLCLNGGFLASENARLHLQTSSSAGDVSICRRKPIDESKQLLSYASEAKVQSTNEQNVEQGKSNDESFRKLQCSPKSSSEVAEELIRKTPSKQSRRKGRRPTRAKRANTMDSTTSNLGKSLSRVSLSRRRNSKNEDRRFLTHSEHLEGDSFEATDSLENSKRPAFRKFIEMPASKPRNVCFDYPGIDLTYVDVQEAIERVIPNAFETNKVVSILFENLNVKLGTRNMKNRWHVELIDVASRNKLIKSGLDFRGKLKNIDIPSCYENPYSNYCCKAPRTSRVVVKLYDSVIMEEYKTFLQKTAASEKLQNVILMCAGRGHSLLSTML